MSHHTPAPTETPATPQQPVTPPAPTDTRLGKLKLAFLYVLIAGLASSAIVAVAALLLWDFTSAMARSLLTIFIFFTHSLIVLGVLWADKRNQVGRLILPTAIVVLALANMITTTLGTWEIISAETAWRAVGLYFLALGAVFVINASLQLRIAQQAVQVALYTSIGFIVATVLAVTPWVLQVVETFDPLYYRVIAALAILTTASFLIALILRGIALAQHNELHATKPVSEPMPNGLLVIYIITGTITAMVWMAGLTGLLVSGMTTQAKTSTPTHDTRYY
tara:strand:- start:13770 stop:14606 length:837 start_codon:yes stop_codon:yes gene_type:complete